MTADAPEQERQDEETSDEPRPGRPRGPLAVTARGRTVLAAGGAVLLLVVVAVVALARGGDGGGSPAPPAADAAKLVPSNALVYVHLSTDRGRSATGDAAKVADRFPSWPALRDGIVSRLQA